MTPSVTVRARISAGFLHNVGLGPWASRDTLRLCLLLIRRSSPNAGRPV